jgi:hypothetical protein
MGSLGLQLAGMGRIDCTSDRGQGMIVCEDTGSNRVESEKIGVDNRYFST